MAFDHLHFCQFNGNLKEHYCNLERDNFGREALSFSFLGECATNVPCLVYTYQSILQLSAAFLIKQFAG